MTKWAVVACDQFTSEPEYWQAVEQQVLVQAINQFLYAQPARKRNIFIRRYWYLTPIREIAKAYGMTESKTASLLFRMRKELKTHLEREGIIA